MSKPPAKSRPPPARAAPTANQARAGSLKAAATPSTEPAESSSMPPSVSSSASETKDGVKAGIPEAPVTTSPPPSAMPPKAPATVQSATSVSTASAKTPVQEMKDASTPTRATKAVDIDDLLNQLPSTQKAQTNAASTAALTKSNQRVRDLEAEVFELQKKLDRSNSRLRQQPGSAEALTRETELENELAVCAEKIATQRNINRSLELTVKQLQSRLTQAEAEKVMIGRTSESLGEDGESGDGLKHAKRSRERELEEALIKAKQEKDRAVKVLITVLGKQRVAAFLSKHAGSPDILDTLCAHFSATISTNDVGRVGDVDPTAAGSIESSGTKNATRRKANNHKKSSAPSLSANRSRSDEMYSRNSQWG